MTDEKPRAPRSLLLPAVLQLEGRAPCFGSIASLSNQGLAFDFQATPLTRQAVGMTAQLDFDAQDQHFSCKGLIINVQDQRVLLSLRDESAGILAALQSVNRNRSSSLARLSQLQVQQACHSQFMDGMKAVVDDFYQLLSKRARVSHVPKEGLDDRPPAADLQQLLNPLRPHLTQQFTRAYPMYPELRARRQEGASRPTPEPVNMDKVDDWIRRTAIAQRVTESVHPLPEEFDRHYTSLNKNGHKHAAHPYQADAVLDMLADLIAPLKLDPDDRARCYELMGQAFQKHAIPLYQGLLHIVAEALSEPIHQPGQIASLEQWLHLYASSPAEGAGHALPDASTVDKLGKLAALAGRLPDNLDELNERLSAGVASQPGAYFPASHLVPGLLARDRIFERFLPDASRHNEADPMLQGQLALIESGAVMPAIGQGLGGLTDLDNAALQGLHALMRQQPAIESGPEKLAQASQIRALMLQAQGLLLEYTLNGLTYQDQPNHPAWKLVNALDALHLGADNRGQFLDPTLHHAINLSMQWLLGQEDVDTALDQVNGLLVKIVTQLQADRQLRRANHLSRLGPLEADPALINTGWCVVKNADEAIPYEVLGRHDGTWMLLDRSATGLLEIPAERFIHDLDNGQIEEAQSFYEPFLDRIADATLTASLDAVHAYTWKDPASGCLKRSALIDELERHLAHPVTEPPTYCVLVEVPTMRPRMSSLPGDELAVMQQRTGEILLGILEIGEHCGRLSDVSFMLVFAPQDPARLAERLYRLKTDMEALHPEWKMMGAVVPLIEADDAPTISNTLRRANQACIPMRQHAGLDLSCLLLAPPTTNQIDPLPFASLYLRCQKIASSDETALPHYEILLGVSEDLVPSHTTQSFVVMAEQTGRIHDLDAWVLKSVLDWMENNPDQMGQLSGLSVNLSGHSLTQTDHVDALVQLIARHPHLASQLIFEVTETAAIGNLDAAVRALRSLRQLGCRVALDDFGSGYSSYAYLRSLPLDYLKIDGTYIRNVLTDKTDQALTASMVDVAHALGLKVIAEYVDSEATRDWLKQQGVDYVQGYWVHTPERLDGLILR
ncbi:MAG: EAL domain-containing protein [Thiobacillus sp.]